MKLTAIILVLGCLFGSLQGEAQLVTLSVKNAKLETVLKQIKKQTGYSFFFNEMFYSKAAKVSLGLQGVSLNEALDACFKQQAELKYTIVGRTVVVAEKEKPAVPGATSADGNAGATANNETVVKGFVYNKRFEALANATVMLKGSQKGTTTNANGSFSMPGAKTGDILSVSYIGYKTTDMVANAEVMNTIILEDASNELDQVVAQGYSKTTRRLSTSSVAKVTAEEIARQPVMNPLLTLQGKVPGMVVTPVTGFASGPITIDVRGKGLLSNASRNPLIVIDGTPMNVGSNLGTTYGDGPVQGMMAGFSPARSQNVLFGFNPKDIESIEILRDIAATSIYGSSGANGVILITTKRGKAGTSDLNVNVNYGASKITRYWKMLNTPQYLEMRREAFRNDGITPTIVNAPDLLLWDTTKYTDWQKEVWGKTGRVMNAMISYSGGSPQFTHRISGNYSTSDEITVASGKNETMGFSLALDRRSDNQKFRTSFTANYNYSFQNMIHSPSVANLPPNAPPMLDSAGNLNFKAWNNTAFEGNFETFGLLFKPVESRTHAFSVNFTLSYQLMRGLTFMTNIGYKNSSNDGRFQDPIISQNPAKYPQGMALFNKSESGGWNFEPQLTYDAWLFGKGRLGVVTGFTIRKEKRESTSALGFGYANDAMLNSIKHAVAVNNDNTALPYKYNGVMGRLEYVWDNKYIVNGSWRRDGSSRFAPGNRFGNFWSAGAAWIASEEPWIKKNIGPVVSFLKFTANTGTAGNDGGGDYQYLSQWSKEYLLNYDGIVPMTSMHAVNQDYHWQLTREITAGLEMRFLKNERLSLDIRYYRRRVGNQLVDNPTPIFTGFSKVYGNWDATVQNSGWEFTLTATFIENKHFRWSGSANAGFNKNILAAYPGLEFSPNYASFLIGQSTSAQYVLNYLGVDPMTGSYQFEDYSKDGVIDRSGGKIPLQAPGDMNKVVDMLPRISGGIHQNFNYKNIGLFISFDYKIQNGMNALSNVPEPGMFGNIPLEIFDNHWQKPGDQAKYSKFSTRGTQGFARTQSTLGYTDASFIRLSNISFSYQLPENWLKKIGMKQGSFNINARNIFVITRYEGIDPEMQSFNAMPPSKTIMAGLSLTL